MAGVLPAAKVSSLCKLLVMLLLCFFFLPSLFFAVVFFSSLSTLLFVPMLCVLNATLIFSEIIDRAPVCLLRRKRKNIFCSVTTEDAQDCHAEKDKFDAVDHDQPDVQERDAQDGADIDPLEIPATNYVSEEEEEEESDDDDNDNEKINRSTVVYLQKEDQSDRKGGDDGELGGTVKKSDDEIHEGPKFIETLSFWRNRESRN